MARSHVLSLTKQRTREVALFEGLSFSKEVASLDVFSKGEIRKVVACCPFDWIFTSVVNSLRNSHKDLLFLLSPNFSSNSWALLCSLEKWWMENIRDSSVEKIYWGKEERDFVDDKGTDQERGSDFGELFLGIMGENSEQLESESAKGRWEDLKEVL